MDTLAIAERSLYRALLSLRASPDSECSLRELLPWLLRATASRGARLEVTLSGKTIVVELGVVSPELCGAAATASIERGDRIVVSPQDATVLGSPDAYVRAAIANTGYLYLQRAPRRELTYRHRENIELLISELVQICEPSAVAPDAVELGMHESTRRFQTRLVSAALQRSGWNVARAARELRVRRGLIYELVGDARRRRGGS